MEDLVRRRHTELSEDALNLVCCAWRSSTKTVYQSAWHKWTQWCLSQQTKEGGAISPEAPTPAQFVNFLAYLNAKEGLKPGTICVKKSAIFQFLPQPVYKSIVKSTEFRLFLQGLKKSQPRVKKSFIWNVETVIAALANTVVNKESLYLLGRHLALLILLFSGRRVHDLSLLSIAFGNILWEDDAVVLQPIHGSKMDSYSRKQLPIRFVNGPHVSLSIPTLLEYYLRLSQPVRGSHTALFLSPQLPHEPAKPQKLRYWCKSLLGECGVGKPPPGSTRSAIATYSLLEGVPIEAVMERGNWRSAHVVFSHYFRPASQS